MINGNITLDIHLISNLDMHQFSDRYLQTRKERVTKKQRTELLTDEL